MALHRLKKSAVWLAVPFTDLMAYRYFCLANAHLVSRPLSMLALFSNNNGFDNKFTSVQVWMESLSCPYSRPTFMLYSVVTSFRMIQLPTRVP